MGSKLRSLLQLIRWGVLAGATSVLTWAADGLPAAAGELNDWSYDSQARSLTLTVPSDILPSVSVISPDQLLIELPNTQIGSVPSLAVGDGIVDSIGLEQISPETLWVVMEFAEGTVLSGTQSAIPVGKALAGQQWEIHPNLIASNGAALNAAISEPIPTTNSGGADSLRAPEVDLAQADFPNLPVLEPRMTLSEPVIVPPIESLPTLTPTPPPVAEASRPEVGVPILREGNIPAEGIQAESIQAESVQTESIQAENTQAENTQAESLEEVVTEADLPAEPPFLGEETFEVPVIDRTELSSSESNSEFDSEFNSESDSESGSEPVVETEVAEDSAADDKPVAEVITEDIVAEDAITEDAIAEDAIVEDAATTAESEMTAEESPEEAVAAAELEPTVEADAVPEEAIAAVPELQTRVDASFAEEPAAAEGEPEPAEMDFAAQGIMPQNTNRWPDPIPFGEPLPR